MCYTCGCKRPYDNMGAQDNITEDYFIKSGKTKAIGEAGVLKAKENMLELLNAEFANKEAEKPKEQY